MKNRFKTLVLSVLLLGGWSGIETGMAAPLSGMLTNPLSPPVEKVQDIQVDRIEVGENHVVYADLSYQGETNFSQWDVTMVYKPLVPYQWKVTLPSSFQVSSSSWCLPFGMSYHQVKEKETGLSNIVIQMENLPIQWDENGKSLHTPIAKLMPHFYLPNRPALVMVKVNASASIEESDFSNNRAYQWLDYTK